jgi:hypothetical protein
MATALFMVLTVLMTWPLVVQMERAVIGWVGDNFYFVWLVGRFQKALFELHLSPLTVPILNYPEGWNLAYNEITPAMILIALPVSLIGGPTLGYNFSILASFVLSGLGVFWWVRKLTCNTAAGIVAGTVYAFVPYRMSHLLGHLNLMGTQWFPFYFMGLNDLLAERQWSWKNRWLAPVSLGLIGLTSQYYLYMSLLISAAYVAGYFLLVDYKPILQFDRFWKRLAIFAIIAVPLVLLSLAPYLHIASLGYLPQRSFEEVRIWSASPTDFVLPSPRHFIWGRWIERHFDRRLWIENTLYIGAVTSVLAVIAVVKRRQLSCGSGPMKLMAFVSLVAFVLALGTDLHWLGQSVIVGVPQFIQRWYSYSQTFIPLPGYFLFKFLPYYASMRGWMRYGIFVNLFMSLLAGLGTAWLLQRTKKRSHALVTALIVVLVLIDFYPGVQSLSQVKGRSVDTWLAGQSGEGAVAQFPFWQVIQPQHTYYTLIHGKPFIGGFFAAFFTPQFQRIQPVLSSFPDQGSVELLRELGVRWVIVDSSQYQDFAQTQMAIESLGLSFAFAAEAQYVYEVK